MFLPPHLRDSAMWVGPGVASPLLPTNIERSRWIHFKRSVSFDWNWILAETDREREREILSLLRSQTVESRGTCVLCGQLAHSLPHRNSGPIRGHWELKDLRAGRRTCWDYVNSGMSRKVNRKGCWPFQMILGSEAASTLYPLLRALS